MSTLLWPAMVTGSEFRSLKLPDAGQALGQKLNIYTENDTQIEKTESKTDEIPLYTQHQEFMPVCALSEAEAWAVKLRKLKKLHTIAFHLCKISTFRKVYCINIRIYALYNEIMQLYEYLCAKMAPKLRKVEKLHTAARHLEQKFKLSQSRSH
ncbi:MAG: hypothetical protein QM296_02740 [Bacillota bacterium]|nr:hypothetical protein [Bacillota bacterium]